MVVKRWAGLRSTSSFRFLICDLQVIPALSALMELSEKSNERMDVKFLIKLQIPNRKDYYFWIQ